MPRQINLPERPAVQFGVFNRYGTPARTGDTYGGPFVAGHQVIPNYWRRSVHATAPEAEAELSHHVAGWEARVRQTKMAAITLVDVLVGRTFLRATSYAGWGYHLYLNETDTIRITPTRGYSNATVEGPIDQPFHVTRVLATHRTLRLESGDSIVFSKKMELYGEIPTAILDEIFSS